MFQPYTPYPNIFPTPIVYPRAGYSVAYSQRRDSAYYNYGRRQYNRQQYYYDPYPPYMFSNFQNPGGNYPD